jgi:hypothetical protein
LKVLEAAATGLFVLTLNLYLSDWVESTDMVPPKCNVHMEFLVDTIKTSIESVKMWIQGTLNPSFTVHKSRQIRWASSLQGRFMPVNQTTLLRLRTPCYESVTGTSRVETLAGHCVLIVCLFCVKNTQIQ